MSNYTLIPNNYTSSYGDIVAQTFGQRQIFESVCALFIETKGVYEQWTYIEKLRTRQRSVPESLYYLTLHSVVLFDFAAC
jgi:hypothetical protein